MNSDEEYLDALHILRRCRNEKNTLYAIGNGDDALLAERAIMDLSTVGLKTQSLYGIGILTQLANDYGWDNVFDIQLRRRMQNRDVLLALSSSGNSKNVIKGIKAALDIGGYVIALVGGGTIYQNWLEDENYTCLKINGDTEEIEDEQGKIIHKLKKELNV